MDRQTYEMSRRLSHDTMEERVPWTPPRPLTLTGSLVITGTNSTEKLSQRDREMGILQEIFLTKERSGPFCVHFNLDSPHKRLSSDANGFPNCLVTSVPDSPHEPDPEPYEPMPPRLIPLDEVSAFTSLTGNSWPSCLFPPTNTFCARRTPPRRRTDMWSPWTRRPSTALLWP